MIPVNNSAVHVFGGAAGVRAQAKAVARAEHSVVGELISITDKRTIQALRAGARHDLDIRLHGDTDYVRGIRDFRIQPGQGIELTSHGDSPAKLHTKFFVIDGETAVVSTVAPVKKLRMRDALDMSLIVRGAPARALEAAAEAASSGDSARIRTSAHHVRQHGLAFNDRAHGVNDLTHELEQLVDGARSSIYIGSKLIGDEQFVQRLAQIRQDADIRVLLESSSKSDPRDVAAARALGLEVSELDRYGMHGNTIIVDGNQAYFGTAMLTPRGLGRESAGRQSRELGWFTDDQNVIAEVVNRLEAIPGSRAATL